jgi:hypothetical protein
MSIVSRCCGHRARRLVPQTPREVVLETLDDPTSHLGVDVDRGSAPGAGDWRRPHRRRADVHLPQYPVAEQALKSAMRGLLWNPVAPSWSLERPLDVDRADSRVVGNSPILNVETVPAVL